MSLQNELRIGNWVEILGNSKRLDFFTTIQPSSFSVNIDKTYGPIPLDEDWLQKFGFRKVSYWKLDNIIIEQTGNEFALHIPDNDAGYEYSERFKHVHQLQNLYFAIEQKELQLTNETKAYIHS
jgi:hypothetical protein